MRAMSRGYPPVTTIFAFILGWIEQWYENVPACLKVKLKDLPGSRFPESNDLSSAVTVWVVVSLLVHFTVVPTFTVSVSGLKAKFAIDTFVPEDAEADVAEVVAAGAAVAGEAAVDPLVVGIAMVGADVALDPVDGMEGEQADKIRIEAIAKQTNSTFFIITSLSAFPGSPEPYETYP